MADQTTLSIGLAVVLPADGLDDLIAALRTKGRRVVGPVVRDGVIVIDDIESAASLPIGCTDRQEGGSYRLAEREDAAYFGYAVGPHSWKNELLPSVLRLWRAVRDGRGTPLIQADDVETPPTAFLGVRPCDLRAIQVQDRVLREGRYVDSDYATRRSNAFIVAVNCGEPGATCFCVSMGSGPAADSGFDLALTEILDGEHRFLVRVGSDAGADVLEGLRWREATDEDRRAAADVTERAAEHMGRELDTEGIKELLYRNLEHPRWDQVADRCLTCGNCTMVCPTCFCTSIEDSNDLAGLATERVRKWDSCFSVDYAYVHGGSIRPSARARYRQWLTHKLATWHDQFGSSGCVGCGRCITWCPVAIDLTEEVAAIRASSEGGHDA